ncbi:exodeoxyribonuclease III [Microbulbifer thermotolerans]|uniref:Exodeoxyribonuclease III n=1 Tax=Microbulbifer thermotolerans TaxID=252514 RepID=A0A143HM58_MICTH|nr:exodeoxyribonuclease III [Microbulbifer thermotolerans]AMX02576.1 exodeoxyribonuclease III [Microbulbifer thermotolerans]MCX2782350.1 exodeoxyribonuclease III [Microbulbifer thermotolerans]MCX2833611.1 exodeoxyribonuclease III [Microbulbifer thermotolerans]
MKVVSFNVNSIRARLHQLKALVDSHQPDIIGLQETKVTDEDFPVDEVRNLGYELIFFGQKTHYGVALLSRFPFIDREYGFPGDDDNAQRRMVMGKFDIGSDKPLTVINGYFPQGENREHPVKFPNKRKYYADLEDYLQTTCSPEAPVLVIGDMNISPTDQDIGIGEQNRKRWLRDGKCSFLPEEREWLQKIQDWGLEDTFRARYPDSDNVFSWFDYRSRGFERDPKRGLRIDLILASKPLAEKCVDAGVDYDIRSMERPSDHAPVWAQFDI